MNRRQKRVLFGTLTVCIRTDRPAELLNECAAAGLQVRGAAVTETGELCFRASRYELPKLKAVCEKYESAMRAGRAGGWLRLGRTVKRRGGLLAALLACAAAVWVSSLFLWQINVTGCETVSPQTVCAELKELGVGIGTFKYGIRQRQVINELLRRMPELCWAAVNVTGSRAEVTVRESRPVPEITDEKTPTEIVADRDGVLESVTVFSGKALLAQGDEVHTGDVLVTGRTESPLAGTHLVPARARILARTERTAQGTMMLCAQKREPTGESMGKNALIFGGRRMNLYFDTGIFTTEYDKMINGKELSLFGAVLPVRTESAKRLRCALTETRIDPADAEQMLRGALERRMSQELGPDGEILSLRFDCDTCTETVTVTASAQCIEKIGVTHLMETDGTP